MRILGWIHPFQTALLLSCLLTLFHIIATLLQVSKPTAFLVMVGRPLSLSLVFVCFCWGSSLKPRGLHCSPQSVDWENKALASVALPSHSPWYLMRSSLKPTAETNSGRIDPIGSWESQPQPHQFSVVDLGLMPCFFPPWKFSGIFGE